MIVTGQCDPRSIRDNILGVRRYSCTRRDRRNGIEQKTGYCMIYVSILAKHEDSPSWDERMESC
jgi:hypothetical protein